MNNYTMECYEMKRDICKFSKKVSKSLSKPERKFIQDTLYGIAASGSLLDFRNSKKSTRGDKIKKYNRKIV